MSRWGSHLEHPWWVDAPDLPEPRDGECSHPQARGWCGRRVEQSSDGEYWQLCAAHLRRQQNENKGATA